MAKIHATRAVALVGAPFRPQGRNPAQGLDCIGLCILAYGLPAKSARDNYRLRGDHHAELETAIVSRFRKIDPQHSRPGDLLLMRPAVDQVHLGIRTPAGFVHADARLKHVVEVPGQPRWPIAGIYRIRAGKGC